ncbi:MAG: hypothetical protein ABFC24_03540 [Methanoregulaceae archaeon]
MDLSEELGHEMKKTEREHHKTDLANQVRALGLGINRAGHEVLEEIRNVPGAPADPVPENTPE